MATDSKMLSFHPMKTKMAMETKIMPQIVKTASRLNPIFNVAANTTITAMSNAKPGSKNSFTKVLTCSFLKKDTKDFKGQSANFKFEFSKISQLNLGKHI